MGFTGDVGRPIDPTMRPPDPLGAADILVTESTYGDRRHPPDDVVDVLAELIDQTVAKRGTVVVPAFAVGRAQHLLHIVAQLMESGRIPRVPVFLDSPMAVNVTTMFCKYSDEHRLSEEECRQMCNVARYSRSVEDSKAITTSSGPMIVISASGMVTGGRILHHMRRFLPEERNTILFVGYQASGTRGRAMLEGTDELKLHGQYVPVRARIVQAQGLSAHADYQELIEWFAASSVDPRRVFVTHGEPAAADAFRRRLVDAFGWKVDVPDDASSWSLTD